jgi:RNA polymerase sigma factor (sigma-70 family)
MRSLKEWIVAYRQNRSVLNEFFTYQTVRERNANGQTDKMRYIRTRDSEINKLMKEIEEKYSNTVDRKDINGYLLHAVLEVFQTADTERSELEVLKWAKERIKFIVIDELRRNHSLKIDIVPDDKVVNDKDDVVSVIDAHTYQEWLKVEELDSYEKFLELHGGLENILSDKQYEVYTYFKSGLTQQQIAEKMGVSQQYISKTLQSAVKRIRAEYLSFRTYQIMMKSNTYQKVKMFVNQIENMIKYVVDDESKLYEYVANFLKENEENDIPIKLAHKNKRDLNTTVIDALFDYMSLNDLKWFIPYFKGVNEAKTKYEKQRFVRIVNKSFVQYLINADKALKSVNKIIVEREIHDDVMRLIG